MADERREDREWADSTDNRNIHSFKKYNKQSSLFALIQAYLWDLESEYDTTPSLKKFVIEMLSKVTKTVSVEKPLSENKKAIATAFGLGGAKSKNSLTLSERNDGIYTLLQMQRVLKNITLNEAIENYVAGNTFGMQMLSKKALERIYYGGKEKRKNST